MSHEHKWTAWSHVDGCHFYLNNYRCACGAARSTYSERDVSFDPWSAVWMDDEGKGEPCARCAQLLAGAKPKHTDEIVETRVV